VSASEFIVFVDESGDHGLATIDPQFPVFVLAFCIFRKSDYSRGLLPAMTDFKFASFGHDQVILHERDIRKDIGDFSILRDPQRKAAFLEDLTALIESTAMTVVASAIRKDRLVDHFEVPNNPYEIALDFGLKRVAEVLRRRKAIGTISVVIECRGKREDDELELEFRRICNKASYRRQQFTLEPRFVPKSANAPGLQIADLVARPIARYVMNPAQMNRAYSVIEKKLDRNPAGSVFGFGLKVFP
jgi:uncharacterized protein DUF3800